MLRRLAASTLRYARLLANLDRDARAARDAGRPILLCLSVDFDPWHDRLSREGWATYERLLARHGLTGRVTYLINPILWRTPDGPPDGERDVHEAIRASGCEIGLHCHLERLILEDRPDRDDALVAEIGRQRDLLEAFHRRTDPDFRVRSFRSGSRAHSPALFRALRRLGIPCDSTLSHLGGTRRVYDWDVCDDGAPDGVYRMEGDDFRRAADAEPPPGAAPEGALPALLEMPVTSQIPDLAKLARGSRNGSRRGEPLVVSTFVHPYNFHADGRRNLAFEAFYAFVLSRLVRIPGAEFVHMSEAASRWEAWRDGERSVGGEPPPS